MRQERPFAGRQLSDIQQAVSVPTGTRRLSRPRRSVAISTPGTLGIALITPGPAAQDAGAALAGGSKNDGAG